MLYLNEEDIIKLIAEKCNVKAEDVTLKIEIPEATVTAIVDKKPEDVDAMLRQMKQVLNCLHETRNLIG